MADEPILEFTAELKRGDEKMDVLRIEFPYDVMELYGVRGQVKIKATFDGVPYRGSLAKMGHHCHFLIVTQVIRRQLKGKQAGDLVQVTVQRDSAPRVVAIPDDLAALFAKNQAEKQYFDTLAYTHQKEYVVWIESAKRPETREKRLQGTIELLHKKRKNPTDK